jgi:hypothetical protein
MALLVFLSLRALPASTRPGVGILPQITSATQPAASRVDQRLNLSRSSSALTFNLDGRSVQINPLLTFTHRSPDATWTIFAERRFRYPPQRSNLQFDRDVHTIIARLQDQVDEQILADHDVKLTSTAPLSYHFESTTLLHRDVFSHLNYFTQILVVGHRKLSLQFSAIPDRTFDLTYQGYPVGAPAQFAYVDAAGVFHVVRAHSGEKGPFTELAKLTLNGPMTLTLLDDGVPLLSIALDDWAGQVSTQLSPTAGWGVPQNAIEFSLEGDSPDSPASIHITLAATSVGRGWQSVGHRAGAYRNRLTFRVLSNEH